MPKPNRTLRHPKRRSDVNHTRGMDTSTELTTWWYEARGTKAMQIKPQDVIDVLNKAGVKFVLMGAHAMAGWLGENARSTKDVDVLIKKQHHRKAVQAITEAFPHLKVEECDVVTRFRDPQINTIVLDLMKPMATVHIAVFKHTITVENSHEIPDLEMALASKFAAMVSPHREATRKHTDAGDFGNIALENRAKVNREKLRRLGELVYPGGGDEIISMLDDVFAGRILKL